MCGTLFAVSLALLHGISAPFGSGKSFPLCSLHCVAAWVLCAMAHTQLAAIFVQAWFEERLLASASLAFAFVEKLLQTCFLGCLLL